MCSSVPTIDAVIDRILSYALKRGITKSRLAADAGLKDTTLRNFGSPTWNPTRRVIKQVENAIPPDFDPHAPDSPSGSAA